MADGEEEKPNIAADGKINLRVRSQVLSSAFDSPMRVYAPWKGLRMSLRAPTWAVQGPAPNSSVLGNDKKYICKAFPDPIQS